MISKGMAFANRSPIEGRVNREVQTVNWEAGKKGAVETGVKSGLKKAHFYRELEAKKAHKAWIREGLNREVQTVN